MVDPPGGGEGGFMGLPVKVVPLSRFPLPDSSTTQLHKNPAVVLSS